MTDTNLNPADSSTNPGGDGGTNSNQDKPDTVSRSAYERLMDENKANRAKLKAIEDERLKREEDEAKKRGEFEHVLKSREEELAKEREKTKNLVGVIINDRKQDAFTRALGVPLDEKFSPLLDLSQIKTDDDGFVDEASVTKYVNDFKSRYGNILGKPGTGNFPDAKPQGGAGIPAWSTAPAKREDLKERYEALPGAVEKRMRELGITK